MLERSYYFDNLKFVLMFLVVLGHALEPFIDSRLILSIYIFIYSFHMPLFAFISGYFTKRIDSDDYAIKIVKRIFFPYMIFETLYSLFDYWLYNEEKLTFTYFTPTWLMWFLFSLMIWKALLPVLVKLKWILPISIAAAVLVGYAKDASYYGSVSRTIVLLPFFLAGFYTKVQWLDFLRTKTVKVCMLAAAAFTFFGFYHYAAKIKVEWFYHTFPYEQLATNEWYAGLYRLGIMGLAVVLGLGLMLTVTKRKVPLISLAGQNTMIVYLFHGFVIKYFISLNLPAMFNSLASKIAIVLFAFALTLLLSSPILKKISNPLFDMSWAVGRKHKFHF